MFEAKEPDHGPAIDALEDERERNVKYLADKLAQRDDIQVAISRCDQDIAKLRSRIESIVTSIKTLGGGVDYL